MQLTYLIRLIFAIFFLLLTTSIQSTFSGNESVLAQDNIEQQIATSSLSPQEKANLEQGIVILQGEKGNYWGRVLTNGDLETAWEVLTDYENFENFLPNISSSKVIEEAENRLIFEQINVVDLWLFKQEFKVQIEAIKNKPTQVDFKIVDGDLKKLIGKWEISENSPGKILVSHKVEVEPGSNTEKPFFYGVYESSLEETLEAIAQEISQRSQQQSSQFNQQKIK